MEHIADNTKHECIRLSDSNEIRKHYREILVNNPDIVVEENNIVVIDGSALDSCSGILIP